MSSFFSTFHFCLLRKRWHCNQSSKNYIIDLIDKDINSLSILISINLGQGVVCSTLLSGSQAGELTLKSLYLERVDSSKRICTICASFAILW